jgi:hypothetical protein
MKTLGLLVTFMTLSIGLAGCSGIRKSPDVSDSIRKSLAWLIHQTAES